MPEPWLGSSFEQTLPMVMYQKNKNDYPGC